MKSRRTESPLKAEKIELLPGESFRLLQWRKNMHEAELVAADGTAHPFVGSGQEWHHHSQMELTLITKGAGTLFVGDSITPFTAPDLVLIGPDMPHYWHLRQPSSGFAFQFDFEPEHPLWLFPETASLRKLWKSARFGLRFSAPVVRAVSVLVTAAKDCCGMARLARLLQILDTLVQTEPRQMQRLSSKTFAPPTGEVAYRSLQKAIYWVFQSFQEDISFSDVLRTTHMCKATFERHFKRHTGKNFTQFVAEVLPQPLPLQPPVQSTLWSDSTRLPPQRHREFKITRYDSAFPI
jgi:mannose-6-phosphate isomerase-like protein (cupin superfamily)